MNPFEEMEAECSHLSIHDYGINLEYQANFIAEEDADRIFEELRTTLPWHRGTIRMPDGEKPIPRMISWHADEPLTYSYSGITHPWRDWTPALINVRDRIERETEIRFNGVLANFYVNEHDSVSPHADDEDGLESGSPIASVSFGAVRDFIVRHTTKKSRHVLPLGHGSLLMMRGDTQKVSQHSIPKLKIPCGPRINLTFRKAVLR